MGEVWNKGEEMWDIHWKYDPEFTARRPQPSTCYPVTPCTAQRAI